MNWRKASYSGSGGGSCVEVGNSPGHVAVRDTKEEGRHHRTVLAVNAEAWRRFTSDLKRRRPVRD